VEPEGEEERNRIEEVGEMDDGAERDVDVES
jgi:hypothetical protein